MHEQDMIVGTVETRDQAERAVRRLLDAGLSAGQISIVTQGPEAREQVKGDATTGQMALNDAGAGAWIGGWAGGIAGLLTGAALSAEHGRTSPGTGT